MTREMQIAVERAAQAAQSDPLVEALEALRQLVFCFDHGNGSAAWDKVLCRARRVLAKYAPDREGGAE